MTIAGKIESTIAIPSGVTVSHDGTVVTVKGPKLETSYGNVEKADVEMQLSRSDMEEIVNGRMTFQRAFMAGSVKLKGEFKLLRSMDQLFDLMGD